MTLVSAIHHLAALLALFLPTLLGVAVRASTVLAVAGLATMLMRRTSASARHLVWASAVLVTLAIPLLTRVTPRWNARVLPAAPLSSTIVSVVAPQIRSSLVSAPRGDALGISSASTSLAGGASLGAMEIAPASTRDALVTRVSVSPERTSGESWTAAEWIALLWLAGALVVLLRLALGTVMVWNTARGATRVVDGDWLVRAQRIARELGIVRPITLLASTEQSVPVTWGIVYPVVLLPASAFAWDPARRQAVLVHEMAHVERFDALTQMIAQLALALLWFDPLMWIAVRRMRSERERACDDRVLSHGTHASFYAEDLLTMVRTLARNDDPAFAALAMARRSDLEGRMLAILDPRVSRRRLGQGGAIVAIGAALVVALPVAALRPLPRAAKGATYGARSVAIVPREVTHAAARVTDVARDACLRSSARELSKHPKDGVPTIVVSDGPSCVVMQNVGTVTFAADDSGIQSISPGGRVHIVEWVGKAKRSYTAAVDADGTLRESFCTCRRDRSVATGAAWLRTVIPRIVREDAAVAPGRARRIRQRSGVAGVLAEVNAARGGEAKTAYLDALLDEGGLTRDTLCLVEDLGHRALTSDHDKSEFARHVAAAVARRHRRRAAELNARLASTSATSGRDAPMLALFR